MVKENLPLAEFSCSPGCPCARRRSADLGLGERSSPVFRFESPPGRPQGAEAACRRVLLRPIADAMGHRSNAASKLDASRGSTKSRKLIRSLFGHDPSRPIPWAGGREPGTIVAHRLRTVAETFRACVTHFRCGGLAGAPAGEQWAADENTYTHPRPLPSVIFLCAPFWTQEALVTTAPPVPATAPDRSRVARFWTAGAVLHEMLHLVYRGFFSQMEGPCTSASAED